ncbi:ABC transporter B family member 26, chloroplastic isoform X2 [Lycium barbarum]|uniref:ABC transporter B family member 26, chloroplastic isoform X2 n=1 Tax=Lycium barbarum TaxID=112863 RepID=UPI00293F319E|nr:ABC transporter B family member 26, chloroplastic isoform X2 [Lycium barbarum]
MALLLSSVQFQPSLRILHSVQKRQNPGNILYKRSQFYPKSKTQFSFRSLNSASINGFSVQEYPEADSLRESVVKWMEFIRNVIPGGNWWRLSSEDVDIGATAKPVTVLRALQRMWELIAEDSLLIFAAFTALIVTALSEISIPHFLTASIFSAQSSSIPVFHRNVRILVVLCIISGICSGVRGCFFGLANMILVKRMREKLYSTLLLQDISFFDSETVGDLTSRLGADCQQVSRVIGNDLNLILRNVLQGTGALVYLLILSWPLGLCTLAICCALFTIMLLYGQYQKRAAKLTQEYTACANEVAQETFSLMRTVRVYGTEEQELRRYARWMGNLADIALRQSAAYGYWNFSFNTLYHSTQVIAVLLGGISILAGHITAEQLTKFILYSEWLIYSTWWVGDNLSSLMQSIGASEKVFQLMDLSPSGQFIDKGAKLEGLAGRIEFVNVSFYYPSRVKVPVLQHINFVVHPGEVVALIFIDGYPIRDLDIKWLRERIGYVGQEPRLFCMDISSNIRYGCSRNVNQQDVEWAAKEAAAHDFISSFPNGYHTVVDDDLLSGGQKQRIAIARAILRDPDILVLDEATSALDAESEQNVKGVLRAVRRELNSNRTVIVIAHRLSTIQAADRIVVMESGKVVEMGSHKDLLLKDGLYARLTRRQADAVE